MIPCRQLTVVDYCPHQYTTSDSATPSTPQWTLSWPSTHVQEYAALDYPHPSLFAGRNGEVESPEYLKSHQLLVALVMFFPDAQ